jgi:hypothetical protein
MSVEVISVADSSAWERLWRIVTIHLSLAVLIYIYCMKCQSLVQCTPSR